MCEMEARWLILQYCASHWKALHITTKTYLQWYKHYHRKMGAEQNANMTGLLHKNCRTEDNHMGNHETDPDTDGVAGFARNIASARQRPARPTGPQRPGRHIGPEGHLRTSIIDFTKTNLKPHT